MTRHSKLLWITGLALGLLLDLLFWKQSLGVNFTIYSITCVTAGCAVLWANQQRPAAKTLWLLPLILVFAGIVCVRAEPMTVFLSVLFTLFLMLLLSNTFLGGRWFWYGLVDYLNAFIRVGISMVSRPFAFNAEVRKKQAEAGVVGRRLKIWPYVRGFAIALPILAIFASLLASADPVFSNELNTILRYLSIENLPQYIFRMAYILLGAYLLIGVILHASMQSKDEQLIGEEKPIVTPFVGFTEAMIVLGSVTVLFAAFVAVQFRYFFGGQANIVATGFTYAEYARRGFGELVTVAFFSLLLILGLGNATRREGNVQRRSFSALSVAIVLLVLVMLVSAYERLMLYESAYGFSRLRTYTHAALIWIGLLLGAVVVLEILHQQRAFTAAVLIASLGLAITLAVLNVDGLIVKENVQRANQGRELDVPYLVSLSTDSVPTLADAFESPATSSATRDAAGAALFCWQLRPKNTYGDWRSFTFSEWQADISLQRIRGQLSGYRVVDNAWPVKISTPAGASYECYGKVFD